MNPADLIQALLNIQGARQNRFNVSERRRLDRSRIKNDIDDPRDIDPSRVIEAPFYLNNNDPQQRAVDAVRVGVAAAPLGRVLQERFPGLRQNVGISPAQRPPQAQVVPSWSRTETEQMLMQYNPRTFTQEYLNRVSDAKLRHLAWAVNQERANTTQRVNVEVRRRMRKEGTE